jgi:hypothetical protein
MATAVHIPEGDVLDVKSLLDMANDCAVIVERGGVAYQVLRQPGKIAAEILADPTIQWSDAVPDEDWGRDLEEIIAWRKLPERDPWAE